MIKCGRSKLLTVTVVTISRYCFNHLLKTPFYWLILNSTRNIRICYSPLSTFRDPPQYIVIHNLLLKKKRKIIKVKILYKSWRNEKIFSSEKNIMITKFMFLKKVRSSKEEEKFSFCSVKITHTPHVPRNPPIFSGLFLTNYNSIFPAYSRLWGLPRSIRI